METILNKKNEQLEEQLGCTKEELNALTIKMLTATYNMTGYLNMLLGTENVKELVKEMKLDDKSRKASEDRAKKIEDGAIIILDENKELKAEVERLTMLLGNREGQEEEIEKLKQLELLPDKLKSAEEEIERLKSEIKFIRSNSIIPERDAERKAYRLDVKDEVVIQMYKDGVPVSEIATKFGMKYSGIRLRLVKAGVWDDKGKTGRPKAK